jgi:hypothetical protein
MILAAQMTHTLPWYYLDSDLAGYTETAPDVAVTRFRRNMFPAHRRTR